MKKLARFLVCLLTSALVLSSCDKGFDELNTNKLVATSLDPVYLMNSGIANTSYPLTTLVFEIAIVQQVISPFGGALVGGNLNIDNRTRNSGNWQQYYRNVLKYTADVKTATVNDPARSNLYQMARIWHSYASMLLTDSYGDVPYKEASLGYINGTVFPKYDSQQAIYLDILKELDEASAALDAKKAAFSSDILYNGNVTRWKSFGYSLLLRAAMRLSKVDPTTAKTYVAKAVAGGLMKANDDDAIVRHSSQYLNAIGDFLNAAEANNYYLAEPFLNYLKSNNDPRLPSIAVRYVGATSGPNQVASRASTDPKVQIGMPVGSDNGTIGTVAKNAGLASFYDYSQLDRTRMGATTAPVFLITYAQTQLLLAEAIVRGWATGDAAAAYTNGIRAHMQNMTRYTDRSAVSAADIATYLQAHPLETGKELDLINTQYWVASFLNGPEAFANFRRSGFPALKPNPYKGEITEAFIRRLTYPDSELSVNVGNVQEAIGRQGGDKMDTHVWWDK